MKGYKIIVSIAVACIFFGAGPSTSKDGKLDYSTDIRPLLNQHCLKCHGGVRQQGGVSFLFREGALAETESGKRAIVPGDHSISEMVLRMESDDPDYQMPPEGDRIPREEIEKIKQWISEGAEWSNHWAYEPITEPIEVPGTKNDWIQNEIDAFVWEKAREHGLKPSAASSKSNLLRRASLDVIGLPPSEYLAKAFLKEQAISYEGVIDALLSSEHYGERWAAMWMDLARYADSQGYQKDKLRPTMWTYRDWVINAFNEDMPFDQFTIEQLAGDLIEEPTDQQLLATAFHRNTMTNDEGGTDDEEYRVAAVMDRVNTTYEVWQATTISCVQCHSHPYDPIRHDEYYKLYATYNTTLDTDHPTDRPLAKVASIPMQRKQVKLSEQLDFLKSHGDSISPIYQRELAEYMTTLPRRVPVMKEQQEARKTYLFERGNWLVHGKEVSPSIPSYISGPHAPEIEDRMDLAQWLVDENNPLTARVIVNRIWEQIFGNGLVKTVEDLGTQGEKPTHPELLDWLAYRLMHTHQWHLKPLMKDILLSATYRQTSAISATALAKDQANQWLTRGPRIRLSAEQIRDQALYVSGLLNEEVYGPSVMPYQPDGVWNTIRNVAQWKVGKNGLNHRRGLYTFWRRVSPYPSMMTFDTPSRELCVSRRIRTNTPLQALVTLNDPVYVEATQHLTWNVAHLPDVTQQIEMAYQKVLYRKPDKVTIEILENLYETTVAYLQEKEDADNPCKEEDIAYESLFNVVSAILNLDEVIMKG